MTSLRFTGARPRLGQGLETVALSGAELEVRIHSPPADSPPLSGFRVRSRAKPGFSAIMRTIPGGSCRQRRAKPSSVGPSSAGVSVGPYSSTAVLQVRFAISAALAASKVGCLGGSDLGGALSSDRLKQSRAGSVDLARRAADASAPGACLRSSRGAGVRQEWLG